MLPASGTSAPAALPPTRKPIIIVDDDEIGCRAIARLLERQGYSCTQAHSAPEALEAMKSTAFGLIIADINMEGNTHLEFIKNLRDLKNPIPIILITGHASVETAAAATSLNASAYLLKPVETERLLQLVGEEFARRTIFDALQTHRQKQEDALRLMKQLEETVNQTKGSGADSALQAYVTLSFDHLMESLLDLKAMTGTIVAQDAGEMQRQRFSTARPLVLVNAIQDTIQVLERTRHSFKSKELAVLRQKLEVLLNQPKTGFESRAPVELTAGRGSMPVISAEPFQT